MAKPPKVSVLLPAFNAAEILPAAIDSLLAQTLADFELIVLDDGSGDGGKTRAVIEACAGRDRRIRPVFLPHRGLAVTLNTGLALARATFVARMDADDLSLPGRLRAQASYLDANPGVTLVSCLVDHGGDARANAGYARHVAFANACVSHEAIILGLFRDSPLPHPSVMFRRKAVLDAGGYRHGDFPEDFDLWLRLASLGARFGKLEQTLLVWNDPPGRLSRTHPAYAPGRFAEIKAPHLAAWLARHNPHHPRIVVAGAGRITRGRAEYLASHGIKITAYLDIDPNKIGRAIKGRPVMHRDQVPGPDSCFVVSYLSGVGAAEDVADFLESRGFVHGRTYLLAG